jgi:acyl carrier protein
MSVQREKAFPAVLGWWGMQEFIEPHLRYLVADHLGVGDEKLVPEVDLREDLAVDSLDLLELTLAIEAEFGIALPERVLDQVRRYGDLVEATVALVGVRRQTEQRSDPPPAIAARIVSPEGVAGQLDRVGWLTPYAAQTIGEDVLRAGRGARLQVAVAPGTSATGFARVEAAFGWLGARGVQVTVASDDRPRRRPPLPARRTPEDVTLGANPGAPR